MRIMNIAKYGEDYTVCDNCHTKCNIGECGNSISVWFPYGHELDGCIGTLDAKVDFCSSKCLIKYITKKGDGINGSNI